MLQGWINFFFGLWIILSGVIYTLNISINYIIVGIIIGILGIWSSRQWQGIVSAVLGFWLIISGFVPGMKGSVNLLIVGIILTLVSLWQGLSVYENPEPD